MFGIRKDGAAGEDEIEIDQLVVELPEGTGKEAAQPIATEVMLQLSRIIEEI